MCNRRTRNAAHVLHEVVEAVLFQALLKLEHRYERIPGDFIAYGELQLMLLFCGLSHSG